jgi:hypothetical protein
MSTKQAATYVKPFYIPAPGSKLAHIKAGLDSRDTQYLDAVDLDYVYPKPTMVRGRSID